MNIEKLVTYPHFSHIVYVGKYNANNVVEIPKIKTVVASAFADLNFLSYLEKELPKAEKIFLDDASEYSYSYIIEKITNTKRKVLVLIDETAELNYCEKIGKENNVVLGISAEAFKQAHKVFPNLTIMRELVVKDKNWILVNI